MYLHDRIKWSKCIEWQDIQWDTSRDFYELYLIDLMHSFAPFNSARKMWLATSQIELKTLNKLEVNIYPTEQKNAFRRHKHLLI